MITQETLNQVTHQVMFVTPEMAQDWLLRNTNNRKRSNAATKRWADAMRANVWELSSDAIAFDVNGVLINGQHRLMAVITTGTTQPFLVCHNFPAKSVNALDVGKKRDLSAIITISGHQISQTHTAVCKHLLTPWHQSTLFNANHELHHRKIIALHKELAPKINFVESVIKTKEFTSPELAAFVSAHADLDDEDFIVNLISLIMHGIRPNNTRRTGDEAALRYRDYRLTTRAKGKRNTGMGAFKLLSSVAYKCAIEDPVKRIVMLGSNPFKNYAEQN